MSTDAPEGSGRSAATFGEELRKEREIRGISLKEIADSTKISKRFLELIEKNDFESLPAPVFTRGFVREYARYLGLNSDEMVSRYIHFVDSHPPAEEPVGNRTRQMPNRTTRISTEPERTSWLVPALIALVVALILLAFFLFFRGRNELTRQTAEQKVNTTTPLISEPVPQAAPAATPPPADPSGPMTLKMTITRDVWVTLTVDGQTVVNEQLSPGTEREFKAEKEFRFKTIGNAGGVALTLNGQPLPALGGEGEVLRNRIFNRDNLPGSSRASVDQG